MCAQQPPVLHLMSNLVVQKFTLHRSIVSLLFKNYCRNHILDSTRPRPSCETQIILIEMT